MSCEYRPTYEAKQTFEQAAERGRKLSTVPGLLAGKARQYRMAVKHGGAVVEAPNESGTFMTRQRAELTAQSLEKTAIDTAGIKHDATLYKNDGNDGGYAELENSGTEHLNVVHTVDEGATSGSVLRKEQVNETTEHEWLHTQAHKLTFKIICEDGTEEEVTPGTSLPENNDQQPVPSKPKPADTIQKEQQAARGPILKIADLPETDTAKLDDIIHERYAMKAGKEFVSDDYKHKFAQGNQIGLHNIEQAVRTGEVIIDAREAA